MRVLLVAGSYPPAVCGVGDYTHMLAQALAIDPSISVGVLVRRDTPSEVRGDLQILAVVDRWAWSELKKIYASVRAWAPDVVHIHYPAQGFRGRLPSLLPLMLSSVGYPVVVTLHELPPDNVKGGIRFLVPLMGAAGLIYVRPSFLEAFSRRVQRWIKKKPWTLIESASAVPVSRLDTEAQLKARDQWLGGSSSRLLVFFGFVYRNKGLEALVDIAVSGVDRVVIAGKIGDAEYVDELMHAAELKGLTPSLEFTDYMAADDAASLLAVADAVVLPFVEGGGVWNTSIHGARAQGTFVVTTGQDQLGFHPECNLCVVSPGDTSAMKAAVERYAGRKVTPIDQESGWRRIANSHVEFYLRCATHRRDS